MTVESSNAKSGPYAGAGLAGPFPVTFRFLENSHLQVVQSLGAIETTLALNVDYTVTGAGGPSGGTVNLTVGLLVGETLTIIRSVPVTQLTDYVQSDSFPARSHEDALDKLTMIDQQNAALIAGAIRVPESVTSLPTLPAAAARIGQVLVFDALGDPALASALPNGQYQIGVPYNIQTTPTGGTVYALTANPGLATNLRVYVGGVKMKVNVDFTWTPANPLVITSLWTWPVDADVEIEFVQALPVGVITPQSIAFLLEETGASLIGCTQGGTGSVLRTVEAKLRDTVHVRDKGAVCDGVTNDIVAFQAAHDALEALSGGGTLHVSRMKLNGAFTWNPNKVRIMGDGGTLDWSGLTGVLYAVQLRQTSTDPNGRGALCRAHPWTNCQFLGTGSATGAIAFMKVADNNPIGGVSYLADGITFDYCSCTNWYRDFEFGNGAFFFNFTNGHLNITGGSGYDTSLLVTAATNGGENLNFSNSFASKVYGSLLRMQNPNAYVILKGGSWDYTANIFDVQAGSLDFDGYIENNTDTDYWVKVTAGVNTFARIAGRISVTGAKTSKELFYSDAACVNGGLDIDMEMQFGPDAYPLKLIAGTGRALYRQRATGQAAAHPAIGAGTNMIANGKMATTALTDWTLTGTTPPSASLTYARPGATYSLKFAGTSTNTPSAVSTQTCKPGQWLTGQLYYRIDGVGASGGTFLVQVDYRDAGGTSLGGNAAVTLTTNTSVGAFTQAVFSMLAPAPAGTKTATLQITMITVASGAPAAYVGDIEFAIV